MKTGMLDQGCKDNLIRSYSGAVLRTRIHLFEAEACLLSSTHAIPAPTVEDEHTSKADACGAACHATKKAHSTDYKRKCSIDFFRQPDSHENLTVIAWLKMQTSRICEKHLNFLA